MLVISTLTSPAPASLIDEVTRLRAHAHAASAISMKKADSSRGGGSQF